jgi:hypothetical protein
MVWVPLQLFMAASGDEPRVFEVSFQPRPPGDDRPRELRCTCPGWNLRRVCRHITYVRWVIKTTGGYTPPLATPRSLELIDAVVKSNPEKYRDWLYTNTGILMVRADGTLIAAEGKAIH